MLTKRNNEVQRQPYFMGAPRLPKRSILCQPTALFSCSPERKKEEKERSGAVRRLKVEVKAGN